MFYIRHGNNTLTIIDCCLSVDDRDVIISELDAQMGPNVVNRLISTHPDEDHILGIGYLWDVLGIHNFYCVANHATKNSPSASFERYCQARDGETAFYLYKNCQRRWLNQADENRGSSGLAVLWPDTNNDDFRRALRDAADAVAFNNMCPVLRYSLIGGASAMWIGDLETDFMEAIFPHIELEKTSIVFAPHHGRDSGKIPNSWLERLDPQIIVIGEAPSRHLNYYTGYKIITQNRAGDITFDCTGNMVHIYASNPSYKRTNDDLDDEGQSRFDHYVGSITVETEYTL